MGLLIGLSSTLGSKVYKDKSKARGMLDGFRSHLLDDRDQGRSAKFLTQKLPVHPRVALFRPGASPRCYEPIETRGRGGGL